MIHFNERLPRTDEMEQYEPSPDDPCVGWCPMPNWDDCECERQMRNAEAADERRDEPLWQAHEAEKAQEQEAERRALFAACEGDEGPY
jgi:hypothetical protein